MRVITCSVAHTSAAPAEKSTPSNGPGVGANDSVRKDVARGQRRQSAQMAADDAVQRRLVQFIETIGELRERTPRGAIDENADSRANGARHPPIARHEQSDGDGDQRDRRVARQRMARPGHLQEATDGQHPDPLGRAGQIGHGTLPLAGRGRKRHRAPRW